MEDKIKVVILSSDFLNQNRRSMLFPYPSDTPENSDRESSCIFKRSQIKSILPKPKYLCH